MVKRLVGNTQLSPLMQHMKAEKVQQIWQLEVVAGSLPSNNNNQTYDSNIISLTNKAQTFGLHLIIQIYNICRNSNKSVRNKNCKFDKFIKLCNLFYSRKTISMITFYEKNTSYFYMLQCNIQ